MENNDYAWEKFLQNNFSFWFPKVEHCGIAVPKTFFTKLPSVEENEMAQRLYESFYVENYRESIATIHEWLDKDIIPCLKEKDLTGHIFVKNATFSNKFDANKSCNLYGIDSLADAILRINYEALCCGAEGTTEIVVREYIESDLRRTPCIYNGLPLRNEFRVFYDFDNNCPIFTANYWDWDYVYPHLHYATDKIIFAHEREHIERVFEEKKEEVQELVAKAMKNVEGLDGQWSIDILLDEWGKYWLIDMAVAQQSAYWDKRPKN